MNRRRRFLGVVALGVSTLAATRETRAIAPPRGPALLTVTGAITRTNRAPFDPALDQMMGKHKVSFDKAHAFDFFALRALPAVRFSPTLEYDAKVHALAGPLLADVVEAAGGSKSAATRLVLRAVDGYAVELSMADAHKYRFIVATSLDERPIPLGGLGPLWAVYDADRFADTAARPLNQRFASCPWGLYHIAVGAA